MRAPNPMALEGIRVLDFGHTVMGPCCGLILADLGADVVRIEPAPNGDPTRNLKGFGTGYFGFYNRNKRSFAVDLKTPEGLDIAKRLIRDADVLIENFGPGTMERLGLGYAVAAAINPRLIYASLKGFLKGPYEQRMALDEVVQMMSGLAYMTGPSGQPLRAGTSIIDITGGMFAVIAIQAALRSRDASGTGQLVESSLFETAVFLMGQHLCYAAQSGKPIPPMPERVSAWAIYEPFAVADGRQIFVGITTDSHWQRFCEVADRQDLARDPSLAANNHRIAARRRLVPIIRELFARLTMDQAIQLCSKARIPFAPIARPEELFDDPHLSETGFLLPTRLPGGIETKLPRLPVSMDHAVTTLRNDPPAMGRDTRAILRELGLGETEIETLFARGVVAADPLESIENNRE